MTARGGVTRSSFDPTEWANRRKSAIEKAARLREDRRRGSVNENHTFAPQTNAATNPPGTGKEEHGGGDDSLDDFYHLEGQRMRGNSSGSGQDHDPSYLHDEQDRPGEDDGDMLANEVKRRSDVQGRRGSKDLSQGYSHVESCTNPPEITYHNTTTTTKPFGLPRRGQQQPPHQPSPTDRHNNNNKTGPSPHHNNNTDTPTSRGDHDLSEGYRDRTPGQPHPITFKTRGSISTDPAAVVERNIWPTTSNANPNTTTPGKLSDKAAHDIFSSGLRGEGPLSATKGKSSGSRRPEWNNNLSDEGAGYTPTTVLNQGAPVNTKPRRNSRGGGQQQYHRQASSSSGSEGQQEATVGRGASGWRHKHTRPEWIDNWEGGVGSNSGEGEQEQGEDAAATTNTAATTTSASGRRRRMSDESQGSQEDMTEAARPQLSLLKAKIKSSRGSRRSQSAPYNTNSDGTATATEDLSGGGENIYAINPRLAARATDRAQTTPMPASGPTTASSSSSRRPLPHDHGGSSPPQPRRSSNPERNDDMSGGTTMKNQQKPKQQPPGRSSFPATISPRTSKIKEQQQHDITTPPSRRAGRLILESTDEPSPQEEEDDDADRVECPSCGRKFKEKAFQVHSKVCDKVFQKKRKAFDSRKHRVMGTEQAKFVKNIPHTDKAKASTESTGLGSSSSTKRLSGAATTTTKVKASTNGRVQSHDNTPVVAKASSKPKWKQQSENFREMLKQNRMLKEAEAQGIPLSHLPAPAPSEPDPSLIQCPHCKRRFNEHAAERHIPKCRDIIAKPTSLMKGGGIRLGAASRSRQGSSSSLLGGSGRRDSFGSGRR